MLAQPRDVDRDAQIVALWQQRRAADVGAFCQWLVDFAPWLRPPGSGAVSCNRAAVRAVCDYNRVHAIDRSSQRVGACEVTDDGLRIGKEAACDTCAP